MNIESLRVEMLKCYKGCRIGIMIGSRDISLMWRIGSHWHQAFIKKDKCKIESKEFSDVLKEAKIALIY